MMSTELFLKRLDETLYTNDQGTQYSFLNSLIRSVLQTATVSLLEYCYHAVDDLEQTALPEMAANFRSPADGDFVRSLSTAIPLAREAGFTGCAASWFHSAGPDQPSLAKRAEAWVRHRNDHPGHGVVAENTLSAALAWIPSLARDLVAGLATLLPEVDATGTLTLRGPQQESLEIRSLRFEGTVPIVVRSIAARGAAWRVVYQTLDTRVSTESFYDVDDQSPLVRLTRTESKRYRHIELTVPESEAPSGDSIWQLAVSLPNRQTSAFTGRADEMKQLCEWMDDTDSRVCNVYGEGGIGKTTLVLEFLNGILAQETRATAWRPEVICFFSAKETRWGPDGLQQIQGVVPTVADAAREIARVYEEPLERSWYDGDSKSVIDRAATLMNGLGIPRDRILLVLDNSETLARSATEEEELGRLIAHMGKRLCRVLVTSRRRERLEAHPLLVPPMDDDTGLVLLRQLGKEYNATPLLQAGDATLRRMSRRFGGRPLLLDVCARLIGRFSYSIQRAEESVLRMAGGDLGAFLYEDAWARIAPETRETLLVLGQIGGTVTGEVVGWACAETHVAHGTLMSALDETRFGTLLDYGQHFDVSFDPSARAFLGQKFSGCAAEARVRVERAAATIRRKNEQWLKANHSVVNDRVGRAFSSEAAKAAHRAAATGDNQGAIRWYEEAIQAERGNVALLDRFAWFLMKNQRDFARAARVAKQACEADPRDADSHFTAGMAAARLGEFGQAERLLDQAAVLGKPRHLCFVQKAWARSYTIKALFEAEPINLDEIVRVQAAALALLDQAVLANPVTPLELKHMDEVDRIRRRMSEFQVRAENLRLHRRGTGRRVR